MPLREEDGKLYGPGVYDMKAGTAILVTALRVLREAGLPPSIPYGFCSPVMRKWAVSRRAT